MVEILDIDETLLANPSYARWRSDPLYGAYADIGDHAHADGFIAAIRAEGNLARAMMFQDHLLQKEPYQNVVILRGSKTTETSASRLKDLFLDYTFGRRAYNAGMHNQNAHTKREMLKRRKEMGAMRAMVGGPAQSGNVMIPPKGGWYYALGTASDPARISEYKAFIKAMGRFSFGPDLQALFQASMQPDVCREYISWTLTDGQKTSDPGVLHFDSGQPDTRYDPQTLARKFTHAVQGVQSNIFLPGNVTRTMALQGGGTLVMRTTPERLRAYQDKRQAKQGAAMHVDHIMDMDETAFQIQDGDVLAMRTCGWSDDPVTSTPRLPSYHCAPYYDVYGHPDRAAGRMTAIQSARVSYMHPNQYHHLMSFR